MTEGQLGVDGFLFWLYIPGPLLEEECRRPMSMFLIPHIIVVIRERRYLFSFSLEKKARGICRGRGEAQTVCAIVGIGV